MKKLDYKSSADEVCIQIDKNQQTLSVNYEISSLTNEKAASLATQSVQIKSPPSTSNYIVILF